MHNLHKDKEILNACLALIHSSTCCCWSCCNLDSLLNSLSQFMPEQILHLGLKRFLTVSNPYQTKSILCHLDAFQTKMCASKLIRLRCYISNVCVLHFLCIVICFCLLSEYKECFSLYDQKRRGKMKAQDLLTVMRSLGCCPTLQELNRHLLTHKIGIVYTATCLSKMGCELQNNLNTSPSALHLSVKRIAPPYTHSRVQLFPPTFSSAWSFSHI